MKRFFFDKAYWPFFLTGLIALSIAIFFIGAYPGSIFDVSVYNRDLSFSNSAIWFVFALYLFFLAGIYFAIGRTRLRTRKWLVISHYVFIALFLVFFALFSSFNNKDVQKLIADVPFVTIVSVYGIIFLADVIFFLLGLILFFVNLLSLRKNKI